MTHPGRPHRAGESIEDLCRACHATRDHTVMAVDGGGQPLRVVCGFCGSQHNYRGGGDDRESASPSRAAGGAPRLGGAPAAPVDASERARATMNEEPAGGDLETLLRRVIREESGLTTVVPAEKWRGGDLILRPGKPGLQEKVLPIETFFHKIVMLRNRLRTLEQQINGSGLPEDQKIKLQTYITGCYGSLTSFNVLFAEEDDQFRGARGQST